MVSACTHWLCTLYSIQGPSLYISITTKATPSTMFVNANNFPVLCLFMVESKKWVNVDSRVLGRFEDKI